jgi:hypothetical protein
MPLVTALVQWAADACRSSRLASSAAHAAGATCINCAKVFGAVECRYYFGVNEVGPLCERCDEVVKTHTLFRERAAFSERALETEEPKSAAHAERPTVGNNTNLPDKELLQMWRRVAGEYAGLTGPLIRYAGMVYRAALSERALETSQPDDEE